MEQPTSLYKDFLSTKIPSLEGKVVLVTGTTSGTGFWTAATAVLKGCDALFLVNRASERSRESYLKLKELNKQSGGSTQLIHVHCDLKQLQSVSDASDFVKRRLKNNGWYLDVFICNAGIEVWDDLRTEDGYDIQFQTNFLSHYLLLRNLWVPLFQKPNDTRIVFVTSFARYMYPKSTLSAKYFMKSLPQTLGGDDPASCFLRYKMAKLACSSLALNLAKLSEEKYPHVKVLCADPGIAETKIGTKARTSLKTESEQLRKEIANFVEDFQGQPAADGALGIVLAAFGRDSEVRNGDHFVPEKNYMSGKPVKSIEGFRDKTKDGLESQVCDDHTWTVLQGSIPPLPLISRF
eukprot:maker-scaffold_41-snap-gene-1.35-mRNA-1 protein AED:0.00 eAED:0.00 QI:356/1/1/1/1/1/2/737/349